MAHCIVCTTLLSINYPHGHGHIVRVGTVEEGQTLNSQRNYWTVDEVLTAMRAGDGFYTYGPTSKKSAWVHPMRCPHCGQEIIRSAHDAVPDNNLDNLPTC